MYCEGRCRVGLKQNPSIKGQKLLKPSAVNRVIYHLIGLCLLNPCNIERLFSYLGVPRQPRTKKIEYHSMIAEVAIHADKSISRNHDVSLFSNFADNPIEDGFPFFDLAAWKFPSPSFCFNQQYLASPFYEHSSSDDMFWRLQVHLFIPTGTYIPDHPVFFIGVDNPSSLFLKSGNRIGHC